MNKMLFEMFGKSTVRLCERDEVVVVEVVTP